MLNFIILTKQFSVPMAIVDYIPVFLFGIACFILIKSFTKDMNKAQFALFSCGICAKVCPLNNITMVDGKPVWGNDCIHWSACINRCPKLAIEYGKKTQGKNRYVAKKYSSLEE